MLSSLVILAGTLALVAQPPSAGDWLLPNFADRIVFEVANASGRTLEQVVVLPCGEGKSAMPACPGRVAVAVDGTDHRFLPSQIDDTDGDGQPDAVDVMVKVPSHATRVVYLYYSSTLRDEPQWPNRVYASHEYGYNRATAAIESTRIGYRIYGGFLLDVQAHHEGEEGLFNALLGYSSTSHPPLAGRDIVHYGQTLGLGGVYVRGDAGTFRPPFNTPDYAGREPQPNEPTYRVLSAGPLRAAIESRLAHWSTPVGEFDVRAIYEMRAEEECVRVHLWAKPLRLSGQVMAGAGVLVLPKGRVELRDGVVAVSGTQDAGVGAISLGMRFSTDAAKAAGVLNTPDGDNRVVEFTGGLIEGEALEVEYTLAAAWQQGGRGDPIDHVLSVLQESAGTLRVAHAKHEQTPHPEDLRREPR